MFNSYQLSLEVRYLKKKKSSMLLGVTYEVLY